MYHRGPLSIGSLLLEGCSWMVGELPSLPGAALGWGLSPQCPTGHTGLDGQETKHGRGHSPLALAAILSRGHAVACTPGSVTAHPSSITPRLS